MDIDKIISGYLNDELSDQEQKELDSWLNEDQGHLEQFDLLKKIWETGIKYPKVLNIDDEQKKLWKRLQGDKSPIYEISNGRNRVTSLVLRYAAIFILSLGIGYVFWLNTKPIPQEKIVVQVFKRENPLGQKSKIQLPDGTMVWLNAGSSLEYTSNFNKTDRKLKLQGEAYFEVTKNESLPFDVNTSNLSVIAVGTSFNVLAFDKSRHEQIALQSGKVKIRCLDEIKSGCTPNYLDPGQMANYNTETGTIRLTNFEANDPFAWKDGKIVFKHATFNEVIETLTRWYNVEFEFSGSVSQEWDYTTTFDNEILTNILESLKYSEKIDYEMEGTKIYLKL